MKPLHLLLGFSAFIVFSLLTRWLPAAYIGIAALVAAALAVAAMLAFPPRWPPKILNVISLVVFAAIALIAAFGSDGVRGWLSTWAGPGVGIVIGLCILALVPVVPFTEQFARESTPRAYWGSPTFVKVNRVLSAVWGAAIGGAGLSRTAAVVIDQAAGHHVGALDLVLTLLVPLGLLYLAFRFTTTYPARAVRG
jgi:hypothetical protein